MNHLYFLAKEQLTIKELEQIIAEKRAEAKEHEELSEREKAKNNFRRYWR